MALTAKQKMFVFEYLIDLNATQAAIRAGYSSKTAKQIGEQNLSKLYMQQAIQAERSAREKRTLITADKVLTELANIAFCNGTEFAKIVEKKGMRPKINGNGEVVGQEEYTYQEVQLISTDQIDKNKKAAISCIKDTKFGIAVESCDKVKALELLGRHLKLFTDKTELTGKDGGPIQQEAVVVYLPEQKHDDDDS